MSSSRPGTCFRLRWTSGAPQELEAQTPPVLYVPEDARLPRSEASAEPRGTELIGTAIGEGSDRRLLSIPECGSAQVEFDVASTIDAILLERYYTALAPTIEMRLPFNSCVPPVVKSVARTLLRGRQAQGPEIDFPSADPGFVVDWLEDLAAELGQPQSRRLPLRSDRAR